MVIISTRRYISARYVTGKIGWCAQCLSLRVPFSSAVAGNGSVNEEQNGLDYVRNGKCSNCKPKETVVNASFAVLVRTRLLIPRSNVVKTKTVWGYGSVDMSPVVTS